MALTSPDYFPPVFLPPENKGFEWVQFMPYSLVMWTDLFGTFAKRLSKHLCELHKYFSLHIYK
jgi:hypothetical protein